MRLLVVVPILAAFMLVMQAWASSGSVSVGHRSAEPGGRGTVDIVARVDGEGLGAWKIDLVYDPVVVAVVGCTAHPHGACSTTFDKETVRMVGVDAVGLTGETVLATFEFECADSEGTTDLEITVLDFGDASDDLYDVDPLDVSDGSFTCGVEDVLGFNGDANCDDSIDSLDALLVLQFEAGLVDRLIFPEGTDSNKDGKIDSRDALLILQFNAGLMPDKMPNFCVGLFGAHHWL